MENATIRRRAAPGRCPARVLALSFCAQAVQVGALPALVSLRLHAGGASGEVLGVVAAAPWVAVLLLSRAIPGLLTRYRYATVNALALGVSAAAVLAILIATGPLPILIANFCLGVGLILRWIACDSWVITLAPRGRRGPAIGLHETLMGLGIAAGPAIIALFGSQGAAPLLVCMGLLAVAACALIGVDGSRASPVPADSPVPGSTRLLGLMALAAFVSGFIETSGVSFLPVIGLQGHWPFGGTLALGAFALGGTLLQVPVGYLADRCGHRAAQLIMAGVIAASGAVLLLPGQEPAAPLLSLFALGGGAAALNTLALIEAGASAAGCIAWAAARVALAYTAGSIIGPPAIGVLLTLLGPAALPLAFAAAGLACCCASAAAFRARA